MKFLKKNLGFTVVELVFVMSLLGVVTLGSGSYIADAFKDSNNLSNKVGVQTSVVALMNKLETTIKEASIPVFKDRTSNISFTNEDFTINHLNDGEITFNYDTLKVTVNGSTYEHIQEITVLPYNNGAKITVVGEGNKYSLTSTYYSRNTGCNHNFVFYSETPAGCENSGEKVFKCEKCSMQKTQTIPETRHYIDNWVELNNTYHEGNCNNCGQNIIEKHIYDNDDDMDCNRCSYDRSPSEEDDDGDGDGHTHNFGDWYIVKEATCEEEGTKECKCDCGVTKEQPIPATGHPYEYNNIDDEDKHEVKCNKCFESYFEAHEYDNDVDPKCNKCGYERELDSDDDSHTHSYTWVVTKSATCTTEGEEKGTCKCGDTKTRVISKLSHTSDTWEKNETHHWKNCTVCTIEFGRAAHTFVDNVCTVCGYKHTHIWDDGKIIKQATCQEKGQIEYTCTISVCGQTKIEEIPLTDHKTSWVRSTTSHYEACENCGYTLSEGVHEFNNDKRTETTHECTVCGYADVHNLKKSYGEIAHWEVCTECAYTTTKEPHKLEEANGGLYHWKACTECAYTTEKHILEDSYGELYHWKACTECAYTTTKETHILKDSYGELYHWKACTECAYTTTKEAHTYSNGKCTTCGYTK